MRGQLERGNQSRKRRSGGDLTREAQSTCLNSLTAVRTLEFMLFNITYIFQKMDPHKKDEMEGGHGRWHHNHPKSVHILVPGSCEYVTLHGKGALQV